MKLYLFISAWLFAAFFGVFQYGQAHGDERLCVKWKDDYRVAYYWVNPDRLIALREAHNGAFVTVKHPAVCERRERT